jgi:hypothetical protein
LWRAVDPDGDPIVSYTITDPAGSGYFQLGAIREPEARSFTVTTAEYASLQYVVSAAGFSDTFTMRASDSHHPNGGASSTFTVVALDAATLPAPNVYVTRDDTARTTSGHPIVVNVLANDDTHLVKIVGLSGAGSPICGNQARHTGCHYRGAAV